MVPVRRLWIFLVAVTAACGATGTTTGPAPALLPTAASTLPGVGSLPNTIPAGGLQSNSTNGGQDALVVITRPVTADGVIAQHIGELVGGNRLLMIGDSIFAGTENRYGGEMCKGLNSLGWTVEVAAEAGRFVEFGVKVAERLMPEPPEPNAEQPDDDWDAVAVFLGSNYNGNQENYDAAMRKILDRAASRPVLLYTVSEYRPSYSEVADVIHQLVEDYENITLIDWARAAKTPGVLSADGLHPTNEGERVLVDLTGAALGRAPDGEVTCIRSQFRDDSAIGQGNGTPNIGGSSNGESSSGGGSSTGGGSTTGSTTTTQPGSSTDGGTAGTTTAGGTTDSDTDWSTTDGGTTAGGTTAGGTTDSGTDWSTTDGGTTDSGTDWSTTDGGATAGGATAGGATAGGATAGGTTAGGTTAGGTTAGGTDWSTTDSGTTTGGTTTGGTTTPATTAAPATTTPVKAAPETTVVAPAPRPTDD
jgi:hypothetical protein